MSELLALPSRRAASCGSCTVLVGITGTPPFVCTTLYSTVTGERSDLMKEMTLGFDRPLVANSFDSNFTFVTVGPVPHMRS